MGRFWRPLALPGAHSCSGCRGGVEPAATAFTAPRATPVHYQHHQSAEGAGVEPARPCQGSTAFQAVPVADRVALPKVSRPGWTRTTALPHVKGTSSPLDDGTVMPGLRGPWLECVAVSDVVVSHVRETREAAGMFARSFGLPIFVLLSFRKRHQGTLFPIQNGYNCIRGDTHGDHHTRASARDRKIR